MKLSPSKVHSLTKFMVNLSIQNFITFLDPFDHNPFVRWSTSCHISGQEVSQPSAISGLQMRMRAPKGEHNACDPAGASTPCSDCWGQWTRNSVCKLSRNRIWRLPWWLTAKESAQQCMSSVSDLGRSHVLGNNNWAFTLQLPGPDCPRARAPQQEKPPQWEACAHRS